MVGRVRLSVRCGDGCFSGSLGVSGFVSGWLLICEGLRLDGGACPAVCQVWGWVFFRLFGRVRLRVRLVAHL